MTLCSFTETMAFITFWVQKNIIYKHKFAPGRVYMICSLSMRFAHPSLFEMMQLLG